MKITATNKATGEVIDLPVNTAAEVVEAWQIAQEYDKASKSLKDQLKKLVPTFINERGLSEPINNCQFRMTTIQRYTYDKAVMRQVLPADDFDVLLKPDKPAVDRYLKDLVANDPLGVVDPGISVALRNSMLPEGDPFQMIKLEKLSRT